MWRHQPSTARFVHRVILARAPVRPIRIQPSVQRLVTSSGVNPSNPVEDPRPQRFRQTSSAFTSLRQEEYHQVVKDLNVCCHSRDSLAKQGIWYSAKATKSGRCRAGDSNGEEARRAIAIDCEMVCVAKKRRELAQLCVVDFLTGQTLVNMYVKPAGPVLDWRTNISGLSPAILQEAEAKDQLLENWKDARQLLLRFIDAKTVIVGHSVHHDLRVLHLSHNRIVDSCTLTADAAHGKNNKMQQLWSLKQLCKEILGLAIQDRAIAGHDCEEDALAVRELVLRCVRHPQELQQWARGPGQLGPVIQPRKRQDDTQR